MARVHVKFPKTGLGNMLLVWANALVFSTQNELPLTTSSWWGIRLGTFIRCERKKRIYNNYFRGPAIGSQLYNSIRNIFSKQEENPSLGLISPDKKNSGTVFIFNKPITHEEFFLELNPYRESIRRHLFELLLPAKRKQLDNYAAPVIAAHVRRGDFKIAHQTTPLDHFIEAIKIIRETSMIDVPVTVFTDAEPHEIDALLQLPAVSLAEKKADILDILLMSKSKVIITSQSSTFSYWAAFLSDAITLIHETDWQHRLRPDENNYKEIRWFPGKKQLAEDLQMAVKNIDFT